MLDAEGNWRYRRCRKHRATTTPTGVTSPIIAIRPDKALRISEPLQSRLTGRTTIVLSKRISRLDGSFGGVLAAAIDSDYFNGFYRTFQLGPDGSISLMRNDGTVLIRWPLFGQGQRIFRKPTCSRGISS